MSLHIVIDGYNLIRQSRRFRDLEQAGLQAGREGLLEVLAAYRKFKPHKITVVFDGGNAEPGMPRRDSYKGVDIRYSKTGELADSVIKNMSAREGERLLVVSSDAEVASYAAAMGSATIGVAEFEARLDLAGAAASGGAAEKDSPGWRPTTRKRGPARRLPKKQRKARIKKEKL